MYHNSPCPMVGYFILGIPAFVELQKKLPALNHWFSVKL